ncbi:putative RTX toxin [Anopheles sinensis]|uniref:Putative RTX toxin n=1 Tax=Anopheles sinensis TaxID=74873 RepID=A0A084W4Z3_ANOSI|nr:putative RTX toxin [Anopheles sinensis]
MWHLAWEEGFLLVATHQKGRSTRRESITVNTDGSWEDANECWNFGERTFIVFVGNGFAFARGKLAFAVRLILRFAMLRCGRAA